MNSLSPEKRYTLEIAKILGLIWSPTKDLSSIPCRGISVEDINTKRGILKDVAAA